MTEWEIFRKRHIPCLLPVLWYWKWDVAGTFDVEINENVHAIDHGDYWAIWPADEKKALAEGILNKLLENFEDLKGYRQRGQESGMSASSFCRKFAKDIEEKTEEEIINFLAELEKLYANFIRHNLVYWIFTGPVIEARIQEELAMDKDETPKIFSVMSHPTENSYSDKIDNEIRKIAEKAHEIGLDDEGIQNDISGLAEKYVWFPFEYTGPNVWTSETVENRVKEILGIELEKRIDISEKQNEIIKKYDLSDEVVKLFRIMQTLALMQDDRKMYNAQSCYYLNGIIMGEVASRLGIEREEALYFDRFLLEKAFDDEEGWYDELKKRTGFFVTYQRKGESIYYYGEDAKRRLDELGINIKADNNKSEIKGRSANPGKATGKVRLFKTSSDIIDFNQGDILMTGMTTPDFVPFMRKAGAIVTDEGGITSHAAIVSRELGIPCVIGCKNATDIFNEGDLVEVDADNGIVRRVK